MLVRFAQALASWQATRSRRAARPNAWRSSGGTSCQGLLGPLRAGGDTCERLRLTGPVSVDVIPVAGCMGDTIRCHGQASQKEVVRPRIRPILISLDDLISCYRTPG